MNTQALTTTKWQLDTAHSELKFKVRHMMITNVSGSFNDFSATLAMNEDFSDTQIIFIVKTTSVDTGNEQRDGHLKSPDFFDSENFPEMKFVSKKMTVKSNNEFQLLGDLTIRDVTKEITLNVEHGGANKDPWGNMKNGFSVEGKINRKEFGLNWNTALETGGVLVSDEVKIQAELQFSQA